MESSSGTSSPEVSKTGASEAKTVNRGRFAAGAAWTGNRNGRPRKGNAMTEILDRLSEMPINKLRAMRTLTGKEAAARMMILESAKAKGTRDRGLMFDRIDGRARQTIAVSEEGTDELIELLDEMREELAAFADPEDA